MLLYLMPVIYDVNRHPLSLQQSTTCTCLPTSLSKHGIVNNTSLGHIFTSLSLAQQASPGSHFWGPSLPQVSRTRPPNFLPFVMWKWRVEKRADDFLQVSMVLVRILTWNLIGQCYALPGDFNKCEDLYCALVTILLRTMKTWLK